MSHHRRGLPIRGVSGFGAICATHAGARFMARAALLLAALGAVALFPPPSVALAQAGRAASGGPVVNWNSSMIYAGLNNGNPEGPVGELAGVTGSGFTVGASVNLALAPGDSSSDPTVCQSGAIPLGSDITVQNDGTFTFDFTWPNTASSGDYSVCALNSNDGSVITGADGGPFHVLSANQPAIQVSNTSVAIGGSITVSGSNWLPPQPVKVFIGSCHNCDASPITNATPASDSSGAFSVQLNIPPGTTVGSYVTSAFTANNSVLDVGLTGGAVALTVVSAAATATTQATTSPTRQATTTVSTTANGGVGGQNTSGGADNTPYIIAIVVSAVVLLLALIGLGAYFLLRRRRAGPATGAPAGVGAVGGAPTPAGGAYVGGYPTPPGAYVAPGSRPGAVTGANTPPDWRVLPNWDNAPTEFFPGGAPGVPSAPTPPTPPTSPLARPSPSAPGGQGASAPFTQSTQPAISSPDNDAPTVPGNFPD